VRQIKLAFGRTLIYVVEIEIEIQPVAGLIYSVLLLATHAHAAV